MVSILSLQVSEAPDSSPSESRHDHSAKSPRSPNWLVQRHPCHRELRSLQMMSWGHKRHFLLAFGQFQSTVPFADVQMFIGCLPCTMLIWYAHGTKPSRFWINAAVSGKKHDANSFWNNRLSSWFHVIARMGSSNGRSHCFSKLLRSPHTLVTCATLLSARRRYLSSKPRKHLKTYGIQKSFMINLDHTCSSHSRNQ